MVRHELKECIQRLAERYELRYLEKHKGFVGIYQGIGVKVFESGGEITLTFFCPTADIDDQILEDFAGFGHWAEAGLPNAWIDALRETGIKKPFNPTISHRGCMIKIDKYRFEHIDIDKMVEFPEIIALDLYEYGATDTWVCDMCKQEPATDAFLDGADASLCNRCWNEVHLAQKSQKRKSVVGPFCWTFLTIGILILASIIWGTFREPSGMDNCNEGIEALDNGSYDLAITYFTKAIRQEPNLAPAYALRANAYHNLGNYDASIKDYTEAIRIVKPTLEELPKEQSAGIYNDRGFSYFLNNDFNHAIADYTKALQLKQDFTAAYFNRGDAYAIKQMYDDAIADYNEVIRHEPNLADAYALRANAYYNLGNYDAAIKDYTEAIRIVKPTLEELPKEQSAGLYNDRGLSYFLNNDFNHAMADYKKAIEIKPKYAEAYNNQGFIFYEMGKYDRAIADYTKAIEINPNLAEAYNNRGLAYHQKNQYNLAIADYTRAIEINPGSTMAYNNRGITYSDRGKYELAISDYTKNLEINPRDYMAYNYRGNAYIAIGRNDQAISDYTKAIEINPGDGLAYNNRAFTYFLKRENDKAWEDVHKAQSLGFEVPTEFIKTLQEASGREK